MLRAKITGIASYVPDDILTNEQLSEMVDTNDEWIMTRVGIKERRILREENAGSSELGARALRKLLEKTNTSPQEIGLVICATSNPDYRFPSTAAIIMEKVGIKSAYGYDIEAACPGFIVALQTGAAYIQAGMHRKIVVVATEKMSSMINYKDRNTCPLFGDAAACVLLEATEEEIGYIDGDYHVDGIGIPHLIMTGGGSVRPASHETIDKNEHYVYQDGRFVFKHAVADMISSTKTVMKRNNLTIEDVDYFIPHQANLRIIEAIAERLNIPEEKMLINIEHYGNTSAASIPLCLAEYEHKLKKGSKLILTAFGAGFTWGSVYLIWGIDPQ